MERDSRLIDLYSVATAMQLQKYKDAFAANRFKHHSEVMEWLRVELRGKISGEVLRKEPFSPAVLPSSLFGVIGEGDEFYLHLFQNHHLIPDDDEGAGDLKPFSFLLQKLYETVWKQQRHHGNGLTASSELEEYFEAEIGQELAVDPEFYGVGLWIGLIDIFHSSHHFYRGLIDHIPLQEIQRRKEELEYQYDGTAVLKELEVMDKHATPEEFNRAYLKLFSELRPGSPWRFVKKLTDGASYAMFFDELTVRQSLVMRMGHVNWVAWLDQLYWPLTQAVFFHSVQNIRDSEGIIREIVNHPANLNTPAIHLLLIALEHHLKLVDDISLKLFELSRDKHHYDEGMKNQIVADGKLKYNLWVDHELRTTIETVIGMSMSNPGLLSATAFLSIFEWVAANQREAHLNTHYAVIRLLVTDIIHETFLKQIQLLNLSSRLRSAIGTNRLNWTQLSLLYAIFRNDEQDLDFRTFLTNKIELNIRSSEFKWNTAYNNETINQVYLFAYLLNSGKDIQDRVNTYYKEFKIHYEGWAYVPRREPESINKELFLLMTGIALSSIYYQDGLPTEAASVFDCFLAHTLRQYRNAGKEAAAKQYTIPLRFLAYIQLVHNTANIDLLVNTFIQKIDAIEDFITVAHELLSVAQTKNISLNPVVIKAIQSHITTNFWVIDERHKTKARSPQRDAYRELKNKIMAFKPV